MKVLGYSLAAAVAVLGFFHFSCSPAMTKQIVKSAIDVALAVCIAENPGSDEKELQALCHYTDELAPAVKDVMAAQRKGALKGNCNPTTVKVTAPSDGGK